MGYGYVADGYWADGYALEFQIAPPPAWLTAPPQTPLPAYLYLQYNSDNDLPGFINAYNAISQQYLTQTNTFNLPVYTSQSGPALDWVGTNLYGLARPILTIGSATLVGGAYNENIYDSISYNTPTIVGGAALAPVSDDIYQRCLTWNLYQGDGRQFTINWLKRRCMRFLNGVNGISYPIDSTYLVSVQFSVGNIVTIAITHTFATASPSNLLAAQALQAVIYQQAVQLPFQYNFTVTY